MRCLPRPRSRRFRALFGLALLAWTMLAFGALAGPVRGYQAVDIEAAMPGEAAPMATAHCHDRSVQQAGLLTPPTAPAGQGDGCQDGCHCLSNCTIALSVPHLLATGVRSQAPVPRFRPDGAPQAPAAPPLRPPIT